MSIIAGILKFMIRTRDANHSNFSGIIPIFKADFCITITNVKANNDFKMVPDKITGVTPTSTPVIPDHR